MTGVGTIEAAESAIRDAMNYHARQAVLNGHYDTNTERLRRPGDDSAHANYHAFSVLRLESALAALTGTDKAVETRRQAWRDAA